MAMGAKMGSRTKGVRGKGKKIGYGKRRRILRSGMFGLKEAI
jgi:hypothetical protein